LNQPGHLNRRFSSILRESGHSTHPWFSGHTGGDNDNVRTPKSLSKTITRREVALDFGRGGDMREVGGNTWRVDDIIQAELKDVRTFSGCNSTSRRGLMTSVTRGFVLRRRAKGWPIPPKDVLAYVGTLLERGWY
jgi:hypothetical protein